MHISEGVLNLGVLGTGYILTSIGVGIGLKSLKEEKIVKTAIFCSAFFVASLIRVPLGPSSVHLVLNGLVGVLLGWQVFCALFIALLLQAILFGFGGLTTLGINTLNMALPGLVCYWFFHRGLRGGKVVSLILGFLAGFLGVFLASICVAASLFCTGEQFLNTAKLIFIAHIPVMFLEGIITALIVQFIKKVKPEILTAT
ncbi:MAG: cobalt transporter CbiM [Candidatus Saelkia tenebricola]|nr:cobalt transporter CbiM [Candidatus Saelkia tenebricola]